MVHENAQTSDPKWLNSTFLEKHIQNSFSDRKITLKNFQSKAATAKGENYNSVIYRINVQIIDEPLIPTLANEQTIRTLNIIAKGPTTNDLAFELLLTYNVYAKEMEFYREIAPKLTSILSEINETEAIVPQVYGICETNNVILFEDMTAIGYKIDSIHRGYNVEQFKKILKKIALFHAAGAVLQERHPDIYKNFEEGLISRKSEIVNEMILTHYDIVIEIISTWPDFAQYTKKLNVMRNQFIEMAKNVCDVNPNEFNTLTQGDLWVNNLLLKYNNATNQIENVVLIDWAYSKWTSPVLDLHYFFNTSLQESFRPGKFDELLAGYYENLKSFLIGLNYSKKIPTLKIFQEQFKQRILYGFITSCLIQPISINENLEEATYENLVTNTDEAMKFKKIIYSNPRVHENLRKLIPYFDQFGVFD